MLTTRVGRVACACLWRVRFFRSRVDEKQAIEHYNRAGSNRSDGYPGVQWPHVALDPPNLERLTEGVLESRVRLEQVVFGADFDVDAVGDRMEEEWRTDALLLHFTPEGVYVRIAFAVRLTLADEDPGEPLIAVETVTVCGEYCLSFTERHGVRPVVDFMAGDIRGPDPDAIKTIDPFTLRIEPAAAVAWALNGITESP